MTRSTINWGILSTAKIATEQVIPAIQQSKSSTVHAIASRDPAKAQHAATALGIPKAHGSYEELLADPEIDAIYNPLPNDLHVDWTLLAARAGKHVLCEKPAGLSAADTKRLLTAPEGTLIAEAFMVRHHPQWQRVRELVRSGELGEVRAVQAVFSYFNDTPADIRNRPENGGGALMDIGCYPITAGRYFYDTEPLRVLALMDIDQRFSTDRQASVIADFGEGRHLSFVVSTQLVPYQSLTVFGTKARAEIQIPYNAPANQPTAIIIDGGESKDGSLSRREIIPACDQYTLQAEAFAQAVLGNRSLDHGVADAIASMRVIDAAFDSARTGNWIELTP